MRFTVLLLLAVLAGTLVCAQDDTVDPGQAPEDPESMQSDAPQEITKAAPQESADEDQEQEKNIVEKGISDIKQVIEEKKDEFEAFIEEAKQRAKHRIHDTLDQLQNNWEKVKDRVKARIFP